MQAEVEQVEKELTRFQKYLDQLFDKALNTGGRVLLVLVLFFLGSYIIKLLRKGIRKWLNKSGIDPHTISVVDAISKILMYLLLIGALLGYFGIQTASVVAVFTSAGVTIGLAFQGTLSNFAAGFLIMLTRPFKIGDYIVLSGSSIEGNVDEIGMFFTRLTTVDNKANIIPNSVMLNSTITNVTYHNSRMLEIIVGVAYHIDIDKVKAVLEKLIEDEKNIIHEQPVKIFVNAINSNSIDIGLRVFVEKDNYWAVKWRMLENIKNKFDENNIEIPFNQMDVHIDNK